MENFFFTNWKELTAFTVILVVFGVLINAYLKQSRDQQKEITDINTKIFNLFTESVKGIAEDSKENKKLNKDMLVIQAQIQKQIENHDKYDKEAWEKLLPAMEKMCDTLNGDNPKIIQLQEELKKIKEKMGE